MPIKVLVDSCAFDRFIELEMKPSEALISEKYYLAVSKAVVAELERIPDPAKRAKALELAAELPRGDVSYFGFNENFNSTGFVPDDVGRFLTETSGHVHNRPNKPPKHMVDRYLLSLSIQGVFLSLDTRGGLRKVAKERGAVIIDLRDFCGSESFTEFFERKVCAVSPQ